MSARLVDDPAALPPERVAELAEALRLARCECGHPPTAHEPKDRGCGMDFGTCHCPLMSWEVLAPLVARWLADAARDAKAEALRETADAWTQGAWADTPRRADRVADRMAAAQHVGDWLRARAAALNPGTGGA